MTKRDKKGGLRTTLTIALLLALAAGAVLIFIYRDALTPESIREFFMGPDASFEEGIDPFAYETSPGQSFAVAGDGLAAVSTTGLRLFDKNGVLAASQVISIARPAVSAAGKHAAFFDIGGKTLRVASFDGEISVLDTEYPIINCTMNKNGWLCVITEDAGYRSLVTVYNNYLSEAYKWHSGSRYVLSASVSPDNRFLAALCAGADGGGAVIFSLSSQDEHASLAAPDELLIDMTFLGNSRLCALSEERIIFFDLSGTILGEYSFGGRFLTDYSLTGGSFVGLLLGKYRSGNEGELVTLDSAGNVLGQLEVMSDYLSISTSGNRLLALEAGGLTLYSDKLAERGGLEDVSGVRLALLLNDSEAFLLTSYAASKHKL